MQTNKIKFKRYCKTLTLKGDPELIEEYKKVHANGGIWPEIAEGMKKVGILDMEIYLYGNQAFMIMDTVPDFDHDRDLARLMEQPRQKEWEKYVSKFQNTSEDASAADKWQLMERIFKIDQEEEYEPIDGQVEEIPVE